MKKNIILAAVTIGVIVISIVITLVCMSNKKGNLDDSNNQEYSTSITQSTEIYDITSAPEETKQEEEDIALPEITLPN